MHWSGRNLGASVVNVGASGEVTGAEHLGGLVGDNDGLIEGSFADVVVTGLSLLNAESDAIGGLVGHNSNNIYNSYASDSVSGDDNVGGLVGDNNGRIINSYAGGSVSGESGVGGLVGRNAQRSRVSASYALGTVSGDENVGGLVGLNFGTLLNTHANGIVLGQNRVGGLVGGNRTADISNSYAIASVSDVSNSGGLIGDTSGGDVVDSYWSVETSGLMQSAGGSAQLTAQLQTPTGATGIYRNWDPAVWDFGTPSDYPLLQYSTGNDDSNPACGRDGQPTCGSTQLHGLADLQVLGSANFIGQFSSQRLHYRINAYIGVTRALNLIPQAINPNAVITISYNGEQINVANGALSDPVVLDPTVDDAIVVSVNTAGRILKYILEIEYFNFDMDRVLADADGDGLIEIGTLEDLYAMRRSLDGSAYIVILPDGTSLAISEGCPDFPTTGCRGFELTRDLNFRDAMSYQSGVINSEWTENWEPIADADSPFDAVFNGNGYDIRHLSLRGLDGKGALGLFHTLGVNAVVENLRLRNVTIHDVMGSSDTSVVAIHQGSLAGENRGRISNVGVSGSTILATLTSADASAVAKIGGLVGLNNSVALNNSNSGVISHSFAHIYIHSEISAQMQSLQNIIGGLVGSNLSSAEIRNSYAVGTASGHCVVGGLVGEHSLSFGLQPTGSFIQDSYAMVDITRLNQTCPQSTNIAATGFGGLIGIMDSAEVFRSYAAARASGRVEGLIGTVIQASGAGANYWDGTLNPRGTSGFLGSSQTTAVLQSTSSAVYGNWSISNWDFGSNQQYPTLRAADGSRAMQVWEESLPQSLRIENATITPINAITEDTSYRDGNRYKLYVDSSRLPLPITFYTTPTGITLYCDDVRCPLTGDAAITLGDTDPQAITMVVRNDNRIMEYYFDVVRENVRLDNVATINLNEGDTFTVAGDYTGSSNINMINWSQTAGPTMNIADADSLNLQLRPQVDLVPRNVAGSDVRFHLTIAVDDENGNPGVYISREISVRINKVDNAPTSGDLTLALGGNKIIVSESLSDIDGDGVTNAGRQFQRRPAGGNWADVDLAQNGLEYTLPSETIDYQYRLTGTYIDGQGYQSVIVSNTITVAAISMPIFADSDGDLVADDDDIDDDNDGLIEVEFFDDLDAIRYQLDGRGYRASADAELNTAGCPDTGCIGYELARSLFFFERSHYRSGQLNIWPFNWPSIGGVFNATFNGNGEVIRSMTIGRSGTVPQANVGLFSEIGSNGKVENLVLRNPLITNLSGIKNVGGIAGMVRRGGIIRNSYVDTMEPILDPAPAIRADRGSLGGLVGVNEGYILSSYVKINVEVGDSDGNISNNGNVSVGGLVGRNRNGGRIHNSYYAGGRIIGHCITGGLVGSQETATASVDAISEIRNSYVSDDVEVQMGASSCTTRYLGGLVGVHVNGNSIISDSYAGGRAYVPSSSFFPGGNVTLPVPNQGVTARRCDTSFTGFARVEGNEVPIADFDANVAGLLNYNPATDRVPTNSYWRREPYLCIEPNERSIFPSNYLRHVVTQADIANKRLQSQLITPIAANVSQTCITDTMNNIIGTAFTETTASCTTYQGWDSDDWDFGTDAQYAVLRHIEGINRGDPACDFDDSTPLPRCGALLSGQSRTNPVSVRQAPRLSITPPQVIINYALNESASATLGSQNTITLSEGDTLNLDAGDSFSSDSAALDYSWRQISGTEILSKSSRQSRISVNVRNDLVAADANLVRVVIRLEVSRRDDANISAARNITIDISKTNLIGSAGSPYWVDVSLFAPAEIVDGDGDTISGIRYQWQRRVSGSWVDIAGATEATYRARNTLNDEHRLRISYIDGQGNSNTLFVSAPSYVAARTVDADADGLIDISTIEQLNAIRHQPDGSGYTASAGATPNTRGCPGGACNGYELVRSLDFDDPDSYSSTADNITARWGDWDPIDNFATVLEGNRHTISNLNIAGGAEPMGLFAATGANAEFRGLRFADVAISGNSSLAAALVAQLSSGGEIHDCHVLSGNITFYNQGGCLVGDSSGTISDSSASCTLRGGDRVGGLAGGAHTIINSSATATMRGVASRWSAGSREVSRGGLVGTLKAGGRIENSHATISLSDIFVEGSGASGTGGLVGISKNNSAIINSYATGDIDEISGGVLHTNVGGLVGNSGGVISGSYAVGNVSGGNQLGGLVGNSSGAISDSYATGNVSGSRELGGLVGNSGGAISGSYAVGNVSGNNQLGGLVGLNGGAINNSYAIGDIMGDLIIGGLVGESSGNVSNSHATGKITRGPSYRAALRIGGLIGDISGGTVSSSYALGIVTTPPFRSTDLGGFAGINRGNINNSYAAALIDAREISRGGFVGGFLEGKPAENSYSISEGLNDFRADGFSGFSNNTRQSYWDIDRSGTSSSGGGEIGFRSEILRSATQPSTTTHPYLNWSSERWSFGTTEQYPALRYYDNTCSTNTPSVNCGNLLPRQRLGLRDLRFAQTSRSGQLQITPPFDGVVIKNDFDQLAVENYAILMDSNISSIEVSAIAADAIGTITINDSPMSVGSADYTFVPDFPDVRTLNILVSQPYEITGEENLDVEYRLTFSTVPEINAITRTVAENENGAPLADSVAIREGHFITLSGELSDVDGDNLSYQWTVDETQVSLVDRATLRGDVVGGSGNAMLSFYLREDFIAADRDSETVNISLTVRDPSGATARREQSFVVNEFDNGAIDSITAPTRDGLTYTAPPLSRVQLAEDPDGAGDPNDIRYQWQRQSGGIWSDVVGANLASYTADGAIADHYRVIINYQDRQGYRSDIVSAPIEAAVEFVQEVVPTSEGSGFEVLLDADGLTPQFERTQTEYAVPPETDSIDIVVITRSEDVFINNVRLEGRVTTSDLDYGNNRIVVEARDEDNTSRNYTILREYDVSLGGWSVAWQGSPDNLDFVGTDLQPDPPVRIPNDIDTITVTARVNELIDIAIRSKGNTVGSITTSTEAGELVARATISNLALGEHDIEFFLRSPDGQSTASHVAKVWRRYNSQLRSLSADRLHPGFNPGQFEYSATISNHEEATTIFFEANEGGTVFVRNNPVTVSNPITGLRIGRNTEQIRVTAPGVPDEEETIYEIIFNREYTLDLRSLSLSDSQMNVVNLSPAFSPTSHTYTTIVPTETSRVIVTFATDLEVGSSVQASNMPTVTDTTIRNNNVQDRIEKTASLPLSFDENTLVIMTSALGEQQATTLTITRLKSANANLQSLQLRDTRNTDLLAGIFATDTLSYDIDVANNTTSSTLILQPQDDKVTSITLNDVPLSLSSLKTTGLISRALPRFIVGDNEIKLKIIAHNEVSSQTYMLTVNREASSNANLDGFSVTPFSEGVPQAPVSPQNFAANTLFYTLPDQENEIDCIRVTPTAADSEATIEITKSGDTPEENYFVGKNNRESSECINLDVGDNTIRIELTATNKTTIRPYTIDIARKRNSNKNLSGPPTVSGTSATRVLGTNNYTATLAINARSFVVSAIAEHPNATVLLTSGGVSVGPRRDALLVVTGISIANPEAQVTIVVTAEDETMQTYTLTVELDVNNDTSLASLTVAGTAAVRQSDGSYTANVSENTTNVSVTAVAGDSNATVAIKEDGNTLESAMTSATSSVRLAETGDIKTLEIEVTAQDVRVSESSTLTIVRAQSSNDCLASLAILNSADNSRADSTTFNSSCGDQPSNPMETLDIENSVAQILIQATAQNSRANIRVHVPGDSDGEQIQSGASNTEAVAVPEGGATTITIVVTAQNGMTNREYTVRVRRVASSDADLEDLELLDVNDVNLLDFATGQQSYDIGVSNASNRATVSAEAHPQAKIKLRIDGAEDIATGTGMISSEFELPGTGVANRIRVRIVVTAQDESTTKGYTVFVTRADPVRTNADLGTIGFEVDRDRDGTYESLPVEVTSPEEGSTTHLARIRGIAELEVQNIIRIRVLPRAFDGAATVSINNEAAMSAPSLDLMLTAALDTTEAPITIKVIAGDGVTSATYSLLITRESSSDTGLSSLTVGGTALQLNDATTEYTAAIAENVMTTDINARTRHSQATLVIREQGDTQTQDDGQRDVTESISIADTGDSKTFDIIVTAQNPSITRTYTLEVSRDPSTNVGLKRITVNGNAATRNDDGTYTASIGENTTKTRVIVESNSPKATVAITLDGVTNSATSRASREFAIDDPGASEQLQIRITAQDDDTAPQDYTLTVRRDLSTDARLSRLELLPQPPGGVEPVIFDSLANTIEHEFPNTVDRIKIRPTAHPFANKVEMFRAGSSVGEIIAKGAESSDIALALGETTTITIVVTAQDTTAAMARYTVIITRAYTLDLRNLSLSDLQMNMVTLMPAFASTRYSYDADSSCGNIRSYSDLRNRLRSKIRSAGIENTDRHRNDDTQ